MDTVLSYVENNPCSLTEQIAAGTGLLSKDVSGILYRLKLQGLTRADKRRWSAIEDAPRQVVTSTWQCETRGAWLDFALAGMAAPLLNNTGKQL